MEKIKAIVIDDERSSLQNLQQKLLEFCPDVEVVATAEKPEEAILLIQQHKPDVIFLDIEMPRMNGFSMLKELVDIHFEIIFTTAYNHYAIDAIKISAFDYLMKPVGIKDLQETVERLKKVKHHHTKEKLDVLHFSMTENKNQGNKISLSTNEGLEFVVIKNILFVESSSNYCIIHFVDGKQMIVTKLLKDFEEMLSSYRFYRIHHSHLINLNYIQKYLRGDGGQVVLQNGATLDVARRKKDDFLKVIGM
jgi:two-component system, LytTR family, response regulator